MIRNAKDHENTIPEKRGKWNKTFLSAALFALFVCLYGIFRLHSLETTTAEDECHFVMACVGFFYVFVMTWHGIMKKSWSLEQVFLCTYPVGALVLASYLPADHSALRRFIGFVIAGFFLYEAIHQAGEKKELFFVTACFTTTMDFVTSGKLGGVLFAGSVLFLGLFSSKDAPRERGKLRPLFQKILLLGSFVCAVLFLYRALRGVHFLENPLVMLGHAWYQQFDRGVLSITGTWLSDGTVVLPQYISFVMLVLALFASFRKRQLVEIPAKEMDVGQIVFFCTCGALFFLVGFVESFGRAAETGVAATLDGRLFFPGFIAFLVPLGEQIGLRDIDGAWHKGICVAAVWMQVLVLTALAVR